MEPRRFSCLRTHDIHAPIFSAEPEEAMNTTRSNADSLIIQATVRASKNAPFARLKKSLPLGRLGVGLPLIFQVVTSPVGIGTPVALRPNGRPAPTGLPGLPRADPSTPLDKSTLSIVQRPGAWYHTIAWLSRKTTPRPGLKCLHRFVALSQGPGCWVRP